MDRIAEPISGEVYEAVTCNACGRVHLINPKTGKISAKNRSLNTLPAIRRLIARELRQWERCE
jgi:hypothetical protein